jgi:hypothetical protein
MLRFEQGNSINRALELIVPLYHGVSSVYARWNAARAALVSTV